MQVESTNGRVVVIGTLDISTLRPAGRPFAALVPACSQQDCARVELLVVPMIDMGCQEINCVGALAEQLHDAIDLVIEDRLALDVATTWNVDLVEGCEHFLWAAGGGELSLLALVSDHAEVLACLKRTAGTRE